MSRLAQFQHLRHGCFGIDALSLAHVHWVEHTYQQLRLYVHRTLLAAPATSLPLPKPRPVPSHNSEFGFAKLKALCDHLEPTADSACTPVQVRPSPFRRCPLTNGGRSLRPSA